jgi:hypothetical protein
VRERDHLEDPCVDGRIILRWIFRKYGGRHGMDRSGSGQGQKAGCCKCDSEPSDSIQREELLDLLQTG